jgi:hypothetical protein
LSRSNSMILSPKITFIEPVTGKSVPVTCMHCKVKQCGHFARSCPQKQSMN